MGLTRRERQRKAIAKYAAKAALLDGSEAPLPPAEVVDPERVLLRAQRAGHRRRNNATRVARRTALVARFRDVPEPRVLVCGRARAPRSGADHVDETVEGGGLVDARAARKRTQVDGFRAAMPALLAGAPARRGVDFGSGAGNLALGLLREGAGDAGGLDAIVAVDINKEAIRLLGLRAPAGRIRCLCADAARLDAGVVGGADCVVSLHGCGALSDLAMDAAIAARLPFAISPCCIGAGLYRREDMKANGDANGARPDSVSYPRSKWLADRLTGDDSYADLASAADYGTSPADTVEARDLQRRAKRLVEADRLAYARERGYSTRLLDLPHGDASVGRRPSSLRFYEEDPGDEGNCVRILESTRDDRTIRDLYEGFYRERTLATLERARASPRISNPQVLPEAGAPPRRARRLPRGRRADRASLGRPEMARHRPLHGRGARDGRRNGDGQL